MQLILEKIIDEYLLLLEEAKNGSSQIRKELELFTYKL